MSAAQSPSADAIGVVGVGWVGLVTAACFASLGHRVWAMDVDEGKIARLSSGEVSFHEPGLAELVRDHRDRLHFTTSMDELLAEARLLFCCVDTPPTYSGDADLSRVLAVVSNLPEDDDSHVLVMKSTVPSGTGESIRRDRPGLAYVSCPEFLKEGSAVKDFLDPDRVVIGADPGDEKAAAAVKALYEPLGGELVVTDVASAEMIKLASNAFLATKISFINEIANVCEEVGADVTEVARGMGLDERIGASFLNAGVGYGGSCFAPHETVLTRRYGRVKLLRLDELWAGHADLNRPGEEVAEPFGLQVWSWVPGEHEPEWRDVSVLTRRPYAGPLVEVQTKSGRRLSVTPDHPFVVGDGVDGRVLDVREAADLDQGCWLPLAAGSHMGSDASRHSILGMIEDDPESWDRVRIRPDQAAIERLLGAPRSTQARVIDRPKPSSRLTAIEQSGAMHFSEAARAGVLLADCRVSAGGCSQFVPVEIGINEDFWRVVGLYLAEGCVAKNREGKPLGLVWTFHPTKEDHLVAEVTDYWKSQGVAVSVNATPTSKRIDLRSPVLAQWWTEELGMGNGSYEQRIPDLAWEQSLERKRQLLGGLWEGDGSWSLVNGGPSVIVEFGTVSEELADGVARMLGELGIVCSWRRGWANKSKRLTHWLRVSGADQIERSLWLVPERDKAVVRACISRQAKRSAPHGYRYLDGMPWVRVVGLEQSRYEGFVYSLEVPGSHTIATSGGLIAHQCFPKDVSALKQLAGNSGYHFQLLNSVIEVNELQKRRVIGKLTKHLGSLVGKRIALLGLAFKPNTDDMREASSLVLSARLQGEGASVVAYDPVASGAASALLPTVEMAASAEDALRDADGAILVTEWPQFVELDWAALGKSMKTPLLVDGRNLLDPTTLAAAGFVYEGIGRNGLGA